MNYQTGAVTPQQPPAHHDGAVPMAIDSEVPEDYYKPTPVPVSQRLKVKSNLKDYEILKTLGTGSFGRVHLVRVRSEHDKYFAMKVLKKTEIVKLKQVEHTNNERAILDDLDHPFLVNMISHFQDSINLYMAMEYVPGGELFSYLRRSGVRLERRLARIGNSLLTAFWFSRGSRTTSLDSTRQRLFWRSNTSIRRTLFTAI